MEDDFPTPLVVEALPWAGSHVVAHNLEVIGLGLAEQVLEQGADDGLHAATEDDNGDIVGLGPQVELLETRVELDVLEQDVDALVVGSADAVHHFLERVAELADTVQYVLVALFPQGGTEADVVGQVVIAVLEGHGAVPVGEEDVLGVVLQGWQFVVVDGAHFGGARYGGNDDVEGKDKVSKRRKEYPHSRPGEGEREDDSPNQEWDPRHVSRGLHR